MRKHLLGLASLVCILFAALATAPLQASDIELTYRYTEDGVSSSAEVSSDGIALYSNMLVSGQSKKDEVYVNISTASGAAIQVRKTGDPSGILALYDEVWQSGNVLSLTPIMNVAENVYEAEFRIEVEGVPQGGSTGISLQISQFGGSGDCIVKLPVITLPQTLNDQPKTITLGPNSATYPKYGSGNWYQVLNGAHYSMDTAAGPQGSVITSITSDSNLLHFSKDKADHGGKDNSWYFYYDHDELKKKDKVQKLSAVFQFVYDESDSVNDVKEGTIEFLYTQADHPVSSLAIVPEGKSSLPKLLNTTTETVYFSVYANKGSKANQWVLNGQHCVESGSITNITGDPTEYLSFIVSPENAAKVVYDSEKGYSIERLQDDQSRDYTGTFTLKAYYTPDPSKSVEVNMACVSENKEVYWDKEEIDKVTTLKGVQFVPTVGDPGAPEAKTVEAMMYLSPTSGFTSCVLDTKTLLKYDTSVDPAIEDYKEKVWTVSSGNAKVATASLSGGKLTVKPVAFGSTSVTLTSYDEKYGVIMPVEVLMPEYEALIVSYKQEKTTVTQAIYSDPNKAGVDDLCWTAAVPAQWNIKRVAGKSYSFSVKYKHGELSPDKAFDMPQGNGYWYSTNPLYVTVSASGSVKVLGRDPSPAANGTTKVIYVDNAGNEVINLNIEVEPKLHMTHNWDETLKISYKQGKVTGTLTPFTTEQAASTLNVSLHDKAYTLKPTVVQTSATGKQSTKKPKVFYVSDDPTKVHVSAKGLLTPVAATSGSVAIHIYSLDSGAEVKEGIFYVNVTAPAP